jgi:hypothetical protein
MLHQKRRPRDYSEKMIVIGYRTIRRIAEMKTRTIDVDTLLEIHREITVTPWKTQRMRVNSGTITT